MKTIISTLLLMSVSLSLADQFHLLDDKGRKHGPVTLEEGATVTTAKEELKVADIKRRDEGLKARLNKIIVPELKFDKADLSGIAKLFEEASRKYDTSRRPEKEKGVTFALVLDYDGANIAPGADAKDVWRREVRTVEERGKLTGSSRNAPLWTVLEAVLRHFDAKPLARDGVVLIVDFNAAEAPIEVRKYDVKPTIMYRMADSGTA